MTDLERQVGEAIAIGGPNPDFYGPNGKVKAAIAIVIDEAAKVAEDKYQHTVSQTTERDVAERLCPRIAAAIRALATTKELAP